MTPIAIALHLPTQSPESRDPSIVIDVPNPGWIFSRASSFSSEFNPLAEPKRWRTARGLRWVARDERSRDSPWKLARRTPHCLAGGAARGTAVFKSRPRQYAGSSRIAQATAGPAARARACPMFHSPGAVRWSTRARPRKSANPAWLRPSEPRMARISSGDGVGISAPTRNVRTVATSLAAGHRIRLHRERQLRSSNYPANPGRQRIGLISTCSRARSALEAVGTWRPRSSDLPRLGRPSNRSDAAAGDDGAPRPASGPLFVPTTGGEPSDLLERIGRLVAQAEEVADGVENRVGMAVVRLRRQPSGPPRAGGAGTGSGAASSCARSPRGRPRSGAAARRTAW